jgi:hypothetical protein
MKWIKQDQLRITYGQLRDGRIASPSFRAVALDSRGDAASLSFTLHGMAVDTTAQIGIELRAASTAHLIYVMWRVTEKAPLTVQVKAPLATYLRIKPEHAELVDAPQLGCANKLAARIDGDRLVAWTSERIVWTGMLPLSARLLHGLVGVRTDHVTADITLAAD